MFFPTKCVVILSCLTCVPVWTMVPKAVFGRTRTELWKLDLSEPIPPATRETPNGDILKRRKRQCCCGGGNSGGGGFGGFPLIITIPAPAPGRALQQQPAYEEDYEYDYGAKPPSEEWAVKVNPDKDDPTARSGSSGLSFDEANALFMESGTKADLGRSGYHDNDVRPMHNVLSSYRCPKIKTSLGSPCTEACDCGQNAICIMCGWYKCCSCPKNVHKRDNPHCILRNSTLSRSGVVDEPTGPKPIPVNRNSFSDLYKSMNLSIWL